jgi:hypothetical protein
MLLLPRLAILGIGHLTSFDMRWVQAANLLLATATLALLLLFLRQVDRRLTGLAIAVTACVFSLIQYAALLAPVSIAQQIGQLLTTLVLLLLAVPQIGLWRFIAALASAAIASLSFGSGLVVWAVGAIALATETKVSRARLALWIALSLVFGLSVTAFVGLREYVTRVDAELVWKCVLVLLGHLVQPSATPDPGEAIAFGVTILCFTVVAFGACFSNPTLRPAIRPWGLLVLQGFGAAVLIALARSNGGLEAGARSQYFTAVYPVLIGLAGLTAHAALLTSDRSPRSLGARLATIACAAVTIVAVAASAISFVVLIPMVKGWHRSGEAAVQALATGAADDDLIQRFFYPEPHLVRRGLGLLAEHRLSIFKGIPGRGRPIGGVDEIRGGNLHTQDGSLDGSAAYELDRWVASTGDEAIDSLDAWLGGKPWRAVSLGAPGSLSAGPGREPFTLAIPPLPAGTTGPVALILVARDRAGISVPIYYTLLRP